MPIELRRVRYAHHSIHRPSTQRGFILLPVVLAITLIATVAFLLNSQSAINVNMTAGEAEARQAEYIAAAGLAHATWGAQNSGCAGDMTMPTVPFGQNSYTATVDAGGSTTTGYSFTPDRDTWIKEAAPDENNAGASLLSVKKTPADSFRALYHFDLSSIPNNKKVTAATAWFYVTQNDAQGAINIQRLTIDWTETGATWNTIGSNFESHAYGLIPPQQASGVWVPVNVTALAQAWVNGPATNYGILLNATSSDLESKYTSKESGASQRPYLQVTTGDGDVSPVTITATGTLTGNPSPANDTTRTLAHSTMPVYQPAATVTYQLGIDTGGDVMLDSSFATRNHGNGYSGVSTNTFQKRRTLVHFDLSGIPPGATVQSARLELFKQSASGLSADPTVTLHRVIRDWVEGTKSGGGIADGATWNTWDGVNAWTTPGGDFDPTVMASVPITTTAQEWLTWDITALASGWVNGRYANQGVLLKGTGDQWTEFTPKEASPSYLDKRPRLILTYACECGSPCLAPQGTGNVLMVVGNSGSPAPSDSYKQALLESWGYVVKLIDDGASQSAFDADTANHDAVYVSETVDPSQLGTKVTNASIGVVNEDGGMNAELGLEAADSTNWPVGNGITVTDNSHYITELFATGPLKIYDADMGGLAVGGTPAPDLQGLADWGADAGIAALEAGSVSAGGGTAAGRRVMLPFGRNASIDWTRVNNNGRLILQRALAWGIGATPGASTPPPNLLFASGGATMVQFPSGDLLVIPTTQEQLRIDLIESWGYTVNLIADEDSQANYDAAVAVNDVAYVSSQVSESALGAKLTNAPIGVVNEQGSLVDEFGFGQQSFTYKSRSEVDVLDNSHYITEPFPTGLLTILSGNQMLHVMTANKAPGLAALAQVFNTGSLWDDSLGVIETGGELFGGGAAAGRRVLLPWGDASFDVATLNADGLTLMQRAIEWAEGAGDAPPVQQVLLVVVDPASLTAQEAAKQALMESWGYTVNLIGESASQGEFDAAVATADVAYVAEDITSGTLGTKLREATIGVVIEEQKLPNEFGISSSDTVFTEASIEVTDNTHYITQPFSLGAVAFASSAQPVGGPSGTLAPGLQVLATQPSTSTGMLDVIETGGALYDTGTAAGRRVKLPWGDNDFDINSLTADGLTIMRRAIEWGGGADTGGGGGGGSPPAGPVFEEFTEASNSGTSLAIDKPPGTAAGDLLIAAVATDGNTAASLAAPAGWSILDLTAQNGEVTFGVWWKLAGASEPASYTFSWSGSEQAYGWLMRFTGHDPASPINASANSGGTSGAPSSPTVITTVDDALVLRLGGFDDDDITAGAPGLAGHTAINMNDSGNGPSTTSGGSGHVLQPAAGDSGTSSFSLTSSEEYRTVTIAIAPAP